MKNKLTTKGVLLSLISLLSAFLLLLMACGAFYRTYYSYWISILASVVLFLTLWCAVALIAFNLIGLALPAKLRPILHVLTQIVALLSAATMFLVMLVNSIDIIVMTSSYSYYDTTSHIISTLWGILVMLSMNFAPLVLEAMLFIAYIALIVVFALPHFKKEKTVPVVEKTTVEELAEEVDPEEETEESEEETEESEEID